VQQLVPAVLRIFLRPFSPSQALLRVFLVRSYLGQQHLLLSCQAISDIRLNKK
jgi:hypothetical protein